MSRCKWKPGPRYGGVVIGSEISGSVRNVTISNCLFIGTDRGIRIKARRGRGGVVEDIRASNLVMDHVLCPIVVNLFYECGARDDPRVVDRTAYPVNSGTPQVRRLRFSQITARRIQYAAAFILGLPEMPVEDFVCESSSFFLDPDCKMGGSPVMAPGVAAHCRAGFIARSVKRLMLRSVDVSEQVGPAVSISEASDARLNDLTVSTAGSEPALRLENVNGGHVRGCHQPPQLSTPVEISGSKAKNIAIGDRVYNFGEAEEVIPGGHG